MISGASKQGVPVPCFSERGPSRQLAPIKPGDWMDPRKQDLNLLNPSRKQAACCHDRDVVRHIINLRPPGLNL